MNEKTFRIGGRTFSEADLNEPGTRVNPEAIIRGDMYEVAVGLNGEVRHLTLITGQGLESIRQMLTSDGGDAS